MSLSRPPEPALFFDRSALVAKGRVIAVLTPGRGSSWLNAKLVIDRAAKLLLTAQIPFGGLNGDMSEK
ncbi:MAG: hypothetical protein ACR2JB_20165, partial [Bryobacteraceae bacterium]